jgi:hypothetical protein
MGCASHLHLWVFFPHARQSEDRLADRLAKKRKGKLSARVGLLSAYSLSKLIADFCTNIVTQREIFVIFGIHSNS